MALIENNTVLRLHLHLSPKFTVYIFYLKQHFNFPEETDDMRNAEEEGRNLKGNMSTIMLRMNQNIDEHKRRLKEAVSDGGTAAPRRPGG